MNFVNIYKMQTGRAFFAGTAANTGTPDFFVKLNGTYLKTNRKRKIQQ